MSSPNLGLYIIRVEWMGVICYESLMDNIYYEQAIVIRKTEGMFCSYYIQFRQSMSNFKKIIVQPVTQSQLCL